MIKNVREKLRSMMAKQKVATESDQNTLGVEEVTEKTNELFDEFIAEIDDAEQEKWS